MRARVTKAVKEHISAHPLSRQGLFGLIALALIALIAMGGFLLNTRDEIQIVQVRSNAISADVSVQGTVVPHDEVTLSFEVGGRVVGVYADVGDTVSRGKTIAVLSQDDVTAQIHNLRAIRDAAQVELENLKAGVRPEDIAIAESAYLSAQNQEAQTYLKLGQVLEQAYVILDDAVRTKTDQFFDNPRSATPHLAIPSDTDSRFQVENERTGLELALQGLQYRSFLKPGESDIERVRAAVQDTKIFLDHMATVINEMEGRSSLSTATIDTYRTLVAAARTAVASYQLELIAAVTAYTNAQGATKTSEAQLALKKAGPTTYDINAQEARVRAAEASIDAAQALARQRVITAPFSGTITNISFSQGEVVGPASGTGVTLVSEKELEVESFVPEVYIARIALGDRVTISLDAYPESEVFTGAVGFIDPSATLKDGVSTYRVIISLDEVDARVKTGMNGDVHIKASQNPNIVTVPKSVLINRDGTYYVQVPARDNRVIEREVLIGSFNEADVAEVISGLADGDEIILNPKQ